MVRDFDMEESFPIDSKDKMARLGICGLETKKLKDGLSVGA